MSPTQRTMAYLKRQGYNAWIVEKYISQIRRRLDFCHFADILAFKSSAVGVWAIQTTTNSNVSSHVRNYRTNPYLRSWFNSGNRFSIIAWAKKGPRGKRKLWQETIINLSIRDIDL